MSYCPYCASSLNPDAALCPSCGADVRIQTWALPADIILAKYHLERVLGQGGFGITYLATDTQLNRAVAIKELFPQGSSRQGSTVLPTPSLGVQGFLETKARFLAEAQALAQFSHSGIVRVFDVFEQNATAYLVMEALQGETLGQRLMRGSMPALEVKRLGLRLCEALEVVHTAGLLHRDIKPDNIFLASDRVVLLDFGSARAFAVGAVQQHTRLVTPGYAAPEQYASQAKFAAYTDVYGLAATLYHALEGIIPPSATDRMLGSSLRISKVGVVANAILQGMDIVATKRPASAKAFAVLLENNVPAKPAQVVSSNPAIRQVVNPVPLVRPTLAQVAASMSPARPTLAQVANSIAPPKGFTPSAPIFSATPAPSVQRNSDSVSIVIVATLIILVIFWFGLSILPRDYRIRTQQMNQPKTTVSFVRVPKQLLIDYSASVYNAFGNLTTKEYTALLKNKPFDCLKKSSVQYAQGYDLAWGTPPEAVKSCLVSLEKTKGVRVVVRGQNGFVSVNGR